MTAPADQDPREDRDRPADAVRPPFITLRTLVILVLGVGAGLLVGVLTGSVEAAFAVAVPLILALHGLVG